MKQHSSITFKRIFSSFAKWLSKTAGSALTFSIALTFVLVWLLLGPHYRYSDTWELVINTATSIITFLMVFLLQNTQNRDTVAIQLKLDEIIRAMVGTHNEMLKVEELPDDKLEAILQEYESLANDIRTRIHKGKTVQKRPKIKINHE